MDQYIATIVSTTISAIGGIIVALIANKKSRSANNIRSNVEAGDDARKRDIKKDRIITIIITAFTLIVLYFGSQYVLAKAGKMLSENKPSPFVVYSDIGIPQGDILIWSGADWGKAAPILVNSTYKSNDAPEGNSYFATIGGSGDDNYIGWGIFLGNFNSEHRCINASTVDLSPFKTLKFFVKSEIDLKIEIQQENNGGSKSYPCMIKDYGWDINLKDRFVEVSIPINKFGNVNIQNIYCPFMITAMGNKATFYIDDVRWER